jgi:uncharacterized membrane protein YbhN (UPF0104 family)
LIAAAIFFFVGFSISIYLKPELVSNPQITPIVVLLAFGIPFTIALNSAEIYLTGSLVGLRFGVAQSLRIAIISGAANMLPLPGGPLVRMAAMKSAGARYRDGGAATLAVAIIWVGVALPYAAFWLLPYSWPIAILLISFGLPALGVGCWFARKIAGSWWLAVVVVCLKLALTMLDASRLYLCFWTLGASTTFAQASALSAAGVIGSTASIVPAGLGVREAISAGLATVVGLSAAAGFLAPALNRLLGLAVLIPTALILAARLEAQIPRNPHNV